MTIEEKLQHFHDVSQEAARQEAAQSITDHKKSMDEMLSEHKKAQKQSVLAEINGETENARREVNKALSAEQLTIKREWTKKQNVLKEKLFFEVKELLEQFMSTPQYDDYLCKKIKEAMDFAGKDELFIYLSPADTSRVHALSVRCDFPLEVSEDSFMGGIKAMIPSKNILIDNSFQESYEALRKGFKFDGGLTHA